MADASDFALALVGAAAAGVATYLVIDALSDTDHLVPQPSSYVVTTRRQIPASVSVSEDYDRSRERDRIRRKITDLELERATTSYGSPEREDINSQLNALRWRYAVV